MSMEEPSRRNFLKGALALGAVAVVGNKILRERKNESLPLDAANKTETDHLKQVSTPEQVGGLREYDMGDLEGRTFGPEIRIMIGLEKVPKHAHIDFKHQLDLMWSEKMSRIREMGGDAIPVVQFGEEIIGSYNPEHSTKMSLDNYERGIQEALDEVRIPNIELIRKIPTFTHCTDAQLLLIKSLESFIDARTLLTYSVTEIMPTGGDDSIVGVQLYDFLLRNAGTEYIAAIPAAHDGYLSFGPYQFTRYAIGDVAHVHNGASVMNSILRKPQLPEYVGNMRGGDHHKAAYLLALYNIAHLVKNLGAGPSKKLLDNVDALPKETILQYVATAHHLPGNAITAFKQFALAQTMPKKAHTDTASLTYAHFCKANGISGYCEKTKSNSDALKVFFGA